MLPEKVRKKMLTNIIVSKSIARSNDAAFLRDIVTTADYPKFNGDNRRQCREQDNSVKPSTKAVYLPLIYMVPSDPDTILTALRLSHALTF